MLIGWSASITDETGSWEDENVEFVGSFSWVSELASDMPLESSATEIGAVLCSSELSSIR